MDIIILGLENGAIMEDDVPIISRFVLDGTNTIATQEELAAFLAELSKKWGMFDVLKTTSMAGVKKKSDAEAVAGALTLLQNGNIDGALALAKSATEKDSPQTTDKL